MKKFIVVLCLFYTYLSATQVNSRDVDANKKGIALATYLSLNKAQQLANKFPDNDIYIKQTTTTKKPYFVVFVVNIQKKELTSTLNSIKKKLPTAYTTSDSRVKQLSNDTINTTVSKTKQKPSKQLKASPKSTIIKKIEIKNTKVIVSNDKIIQEIIKRAEAEVKPQDLKNPDLLKTKPTIQNKIIQEIIKKAEAEIKPQDSKKTIIKKIQNLNTNLPAITIRYTKNKSDALKIANGLKYFDMYIRASKLLSKHKFMVYAVNIPQDQVEESLKQINKVYPNAFQTSKIRLNYFSKQESRENVFIKGFENKISNKQNIQLLAINSNKALIKAKKLFNKKQYQNAIDILEQLSQINPSNISINFYLGRSHYQIKNYEKAVSAFERIIIIDENHLRGRLELAQTYFMLGLNEEALKNFNIVLKNNIPANVKTNIEKRVKSIKSKQINHMFYGFASIGFTYDNSINNTDDKTVYIPYQNLLLPTTLIKYDDAYMTLTLSGNYLYKINNKITLQNKLSFIQQKYNDDDKRLNISGGTGIEKEEKKKLELTSYSLYLSTINKDSMFSFGADISNIDLADTGYMKTYGLGINYQKKFFSSITGFSTLKYFKKEHDKLEDEHMNSKTIQLMLGQMYPSTKYGNFNMLYLYTNEKNIKQLNGVMTTNNYPINTKLNANSTIYYNKMKEDNTDQTFNKRREDYTTTLSLGLSYDLSKTTSISSNLKYIKNSSNIELFSYDKNTIDFTIRKSF